MSHCCLVDGGEYQFMERAGGLSCWIDVRVGGLIEMVAGGDSWWLEMTADGWRW